MTATFIFTYPSFLSWYNATGCSACATTLRRTKKNTISIILFSQISCKKVTWGDKFFTWWLNSAKFERRHRIFMPKMRKFDWDESELILTGALISDSRGIAPADASPRRRIFLRTSASAGRGPPFAHPSLISEHEMLGGISPRTPVGDGTWRDYRQNRKRCCHRSWSPGVPPAFLFNEKIREGS